MIYEKQKLLFFKYVGVNDENMKYDRAIISQTTFSPLYFNGLGTQVKGPLLYQMHSTVFNYAPIPLLLPYSPFYTEM